MNEEKKRKVILEKRNAEKIIQKRNVLLTLRNVQVYIIFASQMYSLNIMNLTFVVVVINV